MSHENERTGHGVNRLHTATRWPNDPIVAHSLALTDLVYVQALYYNGFDSEEDYQRLHAIEEHALVMIAKIEKNWKKGKE